MHWAHGMTQGLVRPALGRTDVHGLAAAGTHFALMWTSEAMLYKAQQPALYLRVQCSI